MTYVASYHSYVRSKSKIQPIRHATVTFELFPTEPTLAIPPILRLPNLTNTPTRPKFFAQPHPKSKHLVEPPPSLLNLPLPPSPAPNSDTGPVHQALAIRVPGLLSQDYVVILD